jgi:hypothetical protein
MSRCGFSGTTYSASDAGAANSVVVSASRPTNANQLTTTITGGPAAAPTGAGGAGSGTTTSAFTSTLTSGSSTIVTTGTTTATGAAAPTGTSATVNGAPGLEPLGGGIKALVAVAGAAALGAWMD